MPRHLLSAASASAYSSIKSCKWVGPHSCSPSGIHLYVQLPISARIILLYVFPDSITRH